MEGSPSSSTISSLSAKFYRVVPWKKEKKMIDSFEILEDLCDLLQMMRDFSIQEGAGLSLYLFSFFLSFFLSPSFLSCSSYTFFLL